ncbi:hypothetical protein BU15DRAFT_80242 [Melanogaster broomeanus]|nr:hypothetical protein BU15DRAFT_80242 [Melanogaster broomeanus]
MDGASAAATIMQIIGTGISASLAVYQYGVSVKNAEKSCQRLIEEINLINNLAGTAEEFVRGLSTKTAPDSFCQYWIADHSPAMRYKRTLDQLIAMLSHSHDGSWTNGLRRLMWPGKESEIKAAIESFERYIPYLELSVVMIISNEAQQHHATTVQLRKDFINGAAGISNKVERQRVTTSELQGSIRSAKMKNTYNWMDAVDCTIKYESTLDQRQDNTCRWLFDLRRYSDWCSAQHGFLWLRGKPGAGKSVLLSAVIEDLSKMATDRRGVLAYFYCDFRTDRSTQAFEVVRSLLTQLLRKSKDNWLPFFDDLVDRKSNGSPPPVDLEMLYKLLLKAVRLHNRPVLVIDALDECNDYVKLVTVLERLHKEGCCRLFATSRPLPDAPTAFSALPNIDLNEMITETRCDMTLHVDKEVLKCDKLVPFHEEIVLSLLKKADGMFRWVQCQLDRLSDCRTQGHIRTVLGTLPKGLYETYDRILFDINKKEFDGQIVKSAMLWLVGALKPLQLRVLLEGVTFDIQNSGSSSGDKFLSDADVLNVCGSLVSYNEKTDIVSLSHFSVKEYLLDERLCMGALGQYHLSSFIANNHLAKLCIDYFRTQQRLPELRGPSIVISIRALSARITSLEAYIEQLGIHHLSHAGESEGHLHDLIQSLLAFRNFFRAHVGEPDMALNVLVCYGTPWLLKMYLKHTHTLSLTDISDGYSPLVYAIAHDNYDSADALLNLGLDTMTPCCSLYGSIRYVHPLAAAVIGRHRRMVDFLLSRRCFIPQDIIHVAINSGYECVPPPAKLWDTIVTSLLDHGANVRGLDACANNLLHTLLYRQRHSLLHPRFAKELVDAGCNPRSKNAIGATPLVLALDSQNGAVVDYFLSEGALFEDSRYIHLVYKDWANGLGWYDSAVAAADVAKHAMEVGHSITLADVCRIHTALQSRFKVPSSIIGVILDLAEYWACHTTTKRFTGIRDPLADPDDSDPMFVFLRPPRHDRNVMVQQIEFTASTNRSIDFCSSGPSGSSTTMAFKPRDQTFNF